MARSPSVSVTQKNVAKKLKKESLKGKQRERVETEMDEEEQPGQDDDEREPSLPATQPINGSQEDGNENEDSGDEEEHEAAASGRKRQRINEEGDSITKDESRPKIRTLVRDPDDSYVVGSVVRMHLHNFVTYDDVEFRPGPYLNMVVGPNGSGKSTIACALCLGLAFPASTLGRQTSLQQFVKSTLADDETCFVEVELKGPIGKRNTVVRRTFNRKNNGTSFLLDGETVSIKVVQERMEGLNIRANNLCSFLPQDKVAEFARMSPQELLKETEKAAGDPRLMDWHEFLKGAGKDLQAIKKDAEQQTEELDRLKHLQERDSHDVEIYRERQAQERLLARYTVFHKLHFYHEKMKEFLTAKKDTNKKRVEVHEMEKRNKPINDFEQKLHKGQEKEDKARDRAKKAAEECHKNMNKKVTKCDNLESSVEGLQSQLTALKNREKNRKAQIIRLKDEVSRAQLRVENAPPEVDIGALRTERNQYRPQIASINDRLRDVQEKMRENIDAFAARNQTIDRLQQEIAKIKDKAHQRVEALRRWDQDCADTVKWLHEHRHLFKQEVFEPAIVSLSVPDQRYAPAIESCFSANQLKTFVATCDEDYRTFTRLVNDSTEALGRKGRVNVWFRERSQLPPPPLSPEEMVAHGFDGYATDFVDCPDGLRWYLMKELNLHRTAVKLSENVDCDAMASLIARYEFGANYIAGRWQYRVTKSQYGRRLPQTMSQTVKQPRNLNNSQVDPEVMNRLNREMADNREAQANITEQNREYRTKEEEISNEAAGIKQIVSELQDRIAEATKAQADYKKAELNLKAAKERLEKAENTPPPHEEMERLKSEILKTAVERIRVVKEYTKLLKEFVKHMKLAGVHGLRALHIGANIKGVADLKESYQQGYKTAVAEFQQLKAKYDDLKAEALEHKNNISGELDNAHEDDYDDLEQLLSILNAHLQKFRLEGIDEPLEGDAAKTAQEYEDLMTQTQARIDAAVVANPGIVERYQQREQQITGAAERLHRAKAECLKKEGRVKNIRDKWQPALQSLVKSINEKFSGAFDHIGCAGEVHIKEDEDYDKWAIEIYVKFRDKDELQLLTAQRQSGGERALSTIMYLMSLTDLARSPFSLVDEINQGMDQRAEREVHNQLVKVACAPHSGQYFLITPKLLPALNYHERMKILCVNNGEWLDFDYDIEGHRPNGNMMRMIEETLRKRAPQEA